MDLVRYIIGLLVFLGTSFVLVLAAHLILMRLAKRKTPELWNQKR